MFHYGIAYNDCVAIAQAYRRNEDEVTSIWDHYKGKGMSDTRATYYTQLAVASLTDKSII